MATKLALAEALNNLLKEDYEKFCFTLLSRKEKPRIPRNKVEDKSRLQVTDALVSTFTEAGALRVTLDILREIGCSEEAQDLAAGATTGAAGVKTVADGEHFVDKHRMKLIQRVTNISCISDELLQKRVIQHESYDKIRALSTSQEKMRELYTHLSTTPCKNIFYEILKKDQPLLVEDLEKET